MKSASSFLHATPWWVLVTGGFAILVALALFVTPFNLIRLDESGSTPEENRAIKREIESAFSEGAIDVARGILREMFSHTKDPVRRQELGRALEELDEARQSLREAGEEALRAKREAASEVTGAVKDAADAIAQAQKDAQRALKDAGIENEKVQKALEESLKAAREAQDEARRAESEARQAKSPPLPPPPPGVTDGKRRIIIRGPGTDKPMFDMEVGPDATVVGPPQPPLPPELRQQIRQKVTGDLYRIGVGTGLILLFIPIFILLVVAKIFIDRSRAAQRMADLKRKEAEYHRMSQQVTEAKLSALQAQVEPHFLYNTLASVQALTEVDPQQANAMTGHLIQYLRNALPKMRESVSTVGQEIELVRAYLNILQMRMGKRLAFAIEVPPELMEAPFPPLMLPSLVENAIKHGLEPQREGGEVRITAREAEGQLRLIVADTGRGFAESLGTGVGLTNIRERLAAMYGGQGALTLEANEPHGVVATIEVPKGGREAGAASQPSPRAGFADAAAPAQPAMARTATQKTLAAMGSAERAWRKGLSFAFVVLVVVAAVLAGLGIIGVATGMLPIHFSGAGEVGGATGALIGTAGIAAGFAVVVLALAIVLAVVYGLGFLFAGIAIFVPLVVLIALVPALAPFLLVGLFIWWLVRRSKRRGQEAEAAKAAISPGAQ